MEYTIDGEGRDELGRRYFRIDLPEAEPIVVAARKAVAEPTDLYESLSPSLPCTV
jgi:hypothetical protein